MKYLLIGGKNDGKRIEIEDYCSYVDIVVPPKPLPLGSYLPTKPMTTVFEQEQYLKETFQTGDGQVSIFTISGYTHLDIMRQLIKGYGSGING